MTLVSFFGCIHTFVHSLVSTVLVSCFCYVKLTSLSSAVSLANYVGNLTIILVDELGSKLRQSKLL